MAGILMIIDSFIFNDELDLLELRLGQLDKVTDCFILVETDRTFRGNPKPLWFQENKQKFEKWNHKIVHATPKIATGGGWEFEKDQREALMGSIRSLNAPVESTLVFSDLDEIPNPEIMSTYTPDLGLRNLFQHTFYYNFNHHMNYGHRSWSRARIGRVQDMYEQSVDGFRGGPRDMDYTFPVIENGGWHGSWFGDSLQRVRSKVNAFSHDDLAPYINGRSDRELADDISNGRDLFHRSGIGDAQNWPINDPRLPSYFLENQERFKMFTNAHFVEVHKELLQG
jgi:beta-1,4-mannosyl-glycoprotein beta-1,4-N-acetylglucosaminyltransferase